MFRTTLRVAGTSAVLAGCLALCCPSPAVAQAKKETRSKTSPAPIAPPWWKSNNLRVIQTNLPDYEAVLDPDSLVKDLQYFSANTLIINAGGIMAFYPTQLPFHYRNPHMRENMLGDVVQKCHEKNIRVIFRFDFSKAHKSVFEKHPEWFYLSPKGERITNEDMYAVSMNGGYEQDYIFQIVDEVLRKYPIDGIFMNMPGYQTRNSYLGKYYGIDQNENEKKRFKEFSGGLDLPLEENKNDTIFRKYESFKKKTVDNLMSRLHRLVKGKSSQIAICTYMPEYVDIIRHESQTNGLPYWPYMSSDNVNNTRNSYPDHIVSNASMQQISFQSRYNAVEPEEVYIRLYENIANGAGLDISLMGDFRDNEDQRNFPVFHEVYSLHKKFESYFGNYSSASSIAVISPASWPGGEAAQEYRGIQLMLKEAHLQYDIIEAGVLPKREAALSQYKLLLLPEVTYLSRESVAILQRAIQRGTQVIATNRSFSDDPESLQSLFGACIARQTNDGSGHYMDVTPAEPFGRLKGQRLVLLKFNMGFYEFPGATETLLPLLTPGRPGPPEIIGGHTPTGFFTLGIKDHGSAKAALLPFNLGKFYYLHGYQVHKNLLLDLIDMLAPDLKHQLQTNAHERVEMILQQYSLNTPANRVQKKEPEGMILHLINLTGFGGTTYFRPAVQPIIHVKMKAAFKPSTVFMLSSGKPIGFNWTEGNLEFMVEGLNRFESIVITR